MDSREKKLFEMLQKFSKELPHFPDGRINYSGSSAAAVVTIFLQSGSETLLLKRSEKVSHYKGKWNSVAGFLDELRPLEEKVREELLEELSLPGAEISRIHLGEPYTYSDEKIGKMWHIHPVLVTVGAKPTITLDWEHTEFAWIQPTELKTFDIVPGLEKSYKNALV